MSTAANVLITALLCTSTLAWADNSSPMTDPASASSAAGTASPANSQPASPHHRGDRAAWQAKHQAHFEQQQQALHTALQLSSNQEAAWQSYQAQLKAIHDGATPPDRQALKQQDTLQRLDTMQAWEAQRAKQHSARAQAIRSFYAQLTDAQKKIFDTQGWPQRGQHAHPEAAAWRR